MFPRGPDVFSWAAYQRITHDHCYSRPESLEQHTPIDHGTVHMKNVHWYVCEGVVCGCIGVRV